MDVILNPEMTELDAAGARLAQLEASEQGEAAEATGQPAEREDGGADRAGAEKENADKTPISKQTDTPAAADAAKSQEDKDKSSEQLKADKDKEAAEVEAKKSKFAKNQERLDKTWDTVNKRKAELDTREQQQLQRENQLKQREADLERQAQQAQAQHKPDDYDRASGQKMERAKGLHLQADGLDAKAEKAEENGKYTDAAQLREEAKRYRKAGYKEEGNAEDLKAHAEHLRKNPPASSKELEEKMAAQQKEWTLKAATDFPELGKKGSELQKTVTAHLNQLWQNDRALASHPQIIYHVTRLAAAETAAARVPGLEKELGELKAKVQDYEKLTTPGGPGAAQRTPSGNAPKTDDEERAELSELAEGMGGIR